MNEENKISKTRALTMIFRCFLCLLFASWIILIINKKVDILRYAVFFGAFIFAGFLCYQFSVRRISPKSKSDFDFAMNNVNQAQEILKKRSYLFTKNFPNGTHSLGLTGNTFTSESFSDFAQSPITWVTCAGVGLMLIFHPVYVQVETQVNSDITLIAKTMALSLLQVLLFGLFFSGILLKIENFIKKDKA